MAEHRLIVGDLAKLAVARRFVCVAVWRLQSATFVYALLKGSSRDKVRVVGK